MRGVGSFYAVRCDEDGETYTLRPQKKLRRQGQRLLVGDRVVFTPGQGEQDGWLLQILPRRSELERPSVANVDMLMLVIASVPQPDMLLADRLIVRALRGNMTPALCVNKIDLGTELADAIRQQYRGSPLRLFAVSARTGEGVQALREAMRGRVTCLAGQSAVGKSSLLNALFGLSLHTGELSRKTERGRHTTRKTEMMAFGDTLVLDTPGFSLLDSEPDMEPQALLQAYPEYEALAHACRFAPCLHDTEPGCAVREAVSRGELSDARHARYRQLLRQARENRKGRYA